MQGTDFTDNAHGFTCPANVSCHDRCKNLLGAPDEPGFFIYIWENHVNPPRPPLPRR
jgi:hypothetical protein